MYGRIEDGTVPGPFKRLVAGLLRGLTSKADSALVDCLSGDGRRDVDRCAGAEAETARRHLAARPQAGPSSEEPTSEIQSLMCITYAAFCLKNKIHNNIKHRHH